MHWTKLWQRPSLQIYLTANLIYSPDMLNIGNHHSSEVEINCKIAII
jgi:hypothetical protein